jgi:hypothetical protein
VQFPILRAVSFLTLTIIVLASCSGGSQQTNPTVPPQEIQPAQTSSQSHTYALQTTNGINGTIAIRSTNALPDTTVAFNAERATAQTFVVVQGGRRCICPTIPTIQIRNPFPFPITVDIDGFTIKLPCKVDGQLFGVTFYQTKPQPKIVSPIKLGDVTAHGSIITFTPSVKQLTIPAQTTSALSILAETSTAEVAIPVAPGSTTVLTANAPNVPSSLSFTYNTATGGSLYSSACFNAHDSAGALVPALQNTPLVGTPSFYCQINPANSAITFGQTVQFTIGAPKPDAAVIQLDGPTQAYACSGTAVNCNTPSFNIPTFQKFIAGNVKDLTACVPQKKNTDCNNINGSPSPPPSTNYVKAGQDFQLLVADDPTYKPGTPTFPVPWDGLFRMTLCGPCQLVQGYMPPNLPGYNDNGQGPDAAFTVKPTGKGTCTITAAEGKRYITDFSNPANPKARSTTVKVTIRW